jgi:hypothetical protein
MFPNCTNYDTYRSDFDCTITFVPTTTAWVGYSKKSFSHEMICFALVASQVHTNQFTVGKLYRQYTIISSENHAKLIMVVVLL